jgi:hypothetical protein
VPRSLGLRERHPQNPLHQVARLQTPDAAGIDRGRRARIQSR